MRNKVRYAIRDEYINVMAMTKGGISAKYPYQIIICKRTPISNENGLFLLDAKKSTSTYELSGTGKKYYADLLDNKASEYTHEFAARIDCQLKVKIVPELFEMLYKEGLFSIWTVDAPLKYFEGCETGYLVVFRVFRFKQSVRESLLEKWRKGRNYLFKLCEEVNVDIDRPVVEDDKFSVMKNNLLGILKTNNWLR